MRINQLHLKNFRNYNELKLPFNNQINIFLGNNAQGKTNILEAIYLLALAKSHRTLKDRELVQWGQSFSVIKGTIGTRMGEVNLEIQFSAKGKKVKINNLEKRKLSEYIGTLNVIIFGPEDLSLVKGSPQNRRKFMDMEIGQVSNSYIHHLYQYQKVIQQRNNLLKDFSSRKTNNLELIEIWEHQLINHGSKIVYKRINFIKQLEKWAHSIHYGITEGTENLSIKYKPSFNIDLENLNEAEIVEEFKKNLLRVRKEEISRGSTLIGPHRDDLEFFVNNINVQTFGSQGQQRTTALSLKMAEIELIHEEIGEYPILLLDDVLSELDQIRQTHLLKTIENKVQTIITTTSTDGINLESLSNPSIFQVNSGIVIY